eukprot:2514449-Rhodomonas_salina.1
MSSSSLLQAFDSVCAWDTACGSRDIPVSGTSVGRMIRRICSMLFRSGDRPPCMQKIFSSMMAATGKQLKQSVNVFQILMLYLRLPASFARTIQSPDRQSATDQHEDRLTLVVEAVNPVDRGALVVATKNEEVLRLEKDGLAHEDLPRFVAQRFDLILREVDLLSRPAASNLEQPLNNAVYIQIAHPDLVLCAAASHSTGSQSHKQPSKPWTMQGAECLKVNPSTEMNWEQSDQSKPALRC